jgi:methenyltetrahydromethanopterin cyclohydrolase
LEKKINKKKVNIRRKKVDNGTMLVNVGLKVDVGYNIDNSSPRLGAK